MDDLQSSVDLKSAADAYFANLNSLAKRIHLSFDDSGRFNQQHDATPGEVVALKYFKDILSPSSPPPSNHEKSMKNNGNTGELCDDEDEDGILSTFSSDSSSCTDSSARNNIINKYLFDEKHLLTYARLITGEKQSHDDICGVYLDEHSAPFSFKSKSQINLNMFKVEPDPLSAESSTKPSQISIKPIKQKSMQSIADKVTSSTKLPSSKSAKTKAATAASKKSSNKYSIASSTNSQNSRKTFMSKLFSGVAHASGNSDIGSILAKNDEEKEKLCSNDQSGTPVNISDVRLATNGSSVDETDGMNVSASRQKQSCKELLIKPSEDDLSNGELSADYDFLNNW